METKYEIERRFLIEYPELDSLRSCADETEIVQTYLVSANGETSRVRKRGLNGEFVYTHTTKKRVTAVRRIETEEIISKSDYEKYLMQADPARNVISKHRFCLAYKGQVFEIDIFSFWDDRAIMEIELLDEGQEIEFPPNIIIAREITEDKRYTNASLAKSVPDEPLYRNI